jgi:hypothetical protein
MFDAWMGYSGASALLAERRKKKKRRKKREVLNDSPLLTNDRL